MVCWSSPTDTAAYKLCGVSTYSWMDSGRQTGSAMAIRKSYACQQQPQDKKRLEVRGQRIVVTAKSKKRERHRDRLTADGRPARQWQSESRTLVSNPTATDQGRLTVNSAAQLQDVQHPKL